MKLYDIPAEAQEIESILESNGGELAPEIEQRIADFLREGKGKIEAAAIISRCLESDAQFCRAEAKRLEQRAQGLENSVERLKGLMIYAVDQGFGGKVKTAKFTIWAQNSAPQVNFEVAADADISSLPAEFLRVPQPDINRKALKEAYESGAELPSMLIVRETPGTRFLRIK